MRIGIDFDNTIICYDKIFIELAISSKLVPADFKGNKQELRDYIRTLPDGDLTWQRMQGQAYGALIHHANIFSGFKDFITTCNRLPNIEVFIVSHKTEFGHFDANKVSLRDAARSWLKQQGFFSSDAYQINQQNIFFESTREEKIARIKVLDCTHFIDDLIEVLADISFPNHIKRFLFQTQKQDHNASINTYSSWKEIENAFFVY